MKKKPSTKLERMRWQLSKEGGKNLDEEIRNVLTYLRVTERDQDLRNTLRLSGCLRFTTEDDCRSTGVIVDNFDIFHWSSGAVRLDT